MARGQRAEVPWETAPAHYHFRSRQLRAVCRFPVLWTESKALLRGIQLSACTHTHTHDVQSREAAVRPHPCRTRVLHSCGARLSLALAKRASPLLYAYSICAYARPVTLSTGVHIPSQRVADADFHCRTVFPSERVPVRLACERRAAGSYS